jgi:hypothetical protein
MAYSEKTTKIIVYSSDLTRDLTITDTAGTFDVKHKNASNVSQPIALTASNISLNATNNITLSGNIVGDLHAIKGQLITLSGERNSLLSVGATCFSVGDSSASGTSFGFMVPCNIRLKKFVFASSGTGSNFTTSTKVVFRLQLDGTGQSTYAYCDFSDTTHGNVGVKRFSNKFSSSSTSQVNFEQSITSGYGISLAWNCVTNNINDDNTKFRFTVICETIEDL